MRRIADLASRRCVCLALFFAAAFGGCSSSGGGVDGGSDFGPTDGQGDVPSDQLADIAADGGRRDAGPDFPTAVEAGLDFPDTDATLSTAKVLYIVTQDPDSFGLREVPANGSAPPKAVPAFSGLIDFDTILLAGQVEQLAFDPRRPQVEELVSFTRIHLPGGRGTLYSFRRTLTGSSGILHLDGAGTLRVLHEVIGLYKGIVGLHLGVDATATHAAAVFKEREVVLLRLFGTFAQGGTRRILTLPADVDSVESSSLTFAGGWLYAVGRKKTGATLLLRAEVDSGGALAEVMLDAGKSLGFVGVDLVVTKNGTFIVVRAGENASKLDIYRVAAATGKAVNATKSPAQIVARGARFGGTEGKLAVSSAGGRVAYVIRDASGNDQLFVVAGDGASAAENPTGPKNFDQSALSSLYNVVFAGKDTLLFMAGVGSFQLDLYRYDVTTKAVENLTAIGSTIKPYDGFGGLSARGAWLDEPAGWFYFVGYDSLLSEQDLYGLSLAPGVKTVTKLTSGRGMSSTPSDYAFCPQENTLYFIARVAPTTYRWQLFAADLAKGSAKQLSALGGAGVWQMFNLHASSDCSRLLVSSGPFFSTSRLWTMETAAPASLRPVSTVPRMISATLALTPDGSTVVYGSGGSSDAMTLKSLLSVGSAATVLDPKGGTIVVLGTYP